MMAAMGALGVENPNIPLQSGDPIGISFFCFMSLSYVIDVYRRVIPACQSYLNYLTYISFFPHLVAGPIIRGRDLLPHLLDGPRGAALDLALGDLRRLGDTFDGLDQWPNRALQFCAERPGAF